MKLNSDLQPKVVINEPLYEPVNKYQKNFDLTDVFLFEKGQPYEEYKQLRENSPVHFHEAGIGVSEPGFWVLTKYDDIEFVSRNQQIFSSQLASGTTLTLGYSQEVSIDQLFRSALDHMLGTDDKLHLSMRNPHMKFFTPKYVEELRKKVSLKVTELLDGIAPLGKCNLVDSISSELPIFSLSEILGVPEEDRSKIKEWMTFLEMAQVVGATQAAEKNNIELNDCLLYTSDAADE